MVGTGTSKIAQDASGVGNDISGVDGSIAVLLITNTNDAIKTYKNALIISSTD
jgi:hypothetical protein